MQKDRLRVWPSGRPVWLLVPSVILGASAGLFLYGYWLRDILPIGDEQMLAVTAAASVIAAIGFFLLGGWLAPAFAALTPSRRLGLACVSMPITAFLLFGGTSNWTTSNRYLAFLLPQHRLSLFVRPVEAAAGSALVWFNTSLGDVSYGTVEATGWNRVGDELVVVDPTNNSLTWAGAIGDKLQMVFSATAPGGKATISWDGQSETISLSKGKTAYSRAFAVPFYASAGAIMILGFVVAYALALGLSVLVWQRRLTLAEVARGAASAGAARVVPADLIAVAVAVLLAAGLRAFNLGTLYPAVDEYYHLIAAKQILQGAALSTVYPRGLWIVTLPVAFALRILGNQLWAARLMGVVFNCLAIIPLYLLTRRINRPVAVVACLLYATSPWIITFARVAREYAYYPFYFYWILYGMVELVRRIPRRFVFSAQWRVLMRPGTLGLVGALLLPPIFALKIDWLSTFRTILIAYLVFGLFIVLRLDWRARSNWPILGLLWAGVLASGWSWYLEQGSKLSLLPQLNVLPIEYFLPNPQQQWYLDRVTLVVALGLIAVAAGTVLVWRANFVPLFVVVLFTAYLGVFALFSKAFYHTRHLLSTELWYVIVVAMAFYGVWGGLMLLLPRRTRATQTLLAAVIGISVLNFGQILLPTTSTNPDMPISEDYMHDMSRVQAFMLGKAQPGDALISTVYGQYAIWEGEPAFAVQNRITSHTPAADILDFATKYPSGWIVIDDIRFRLASLSIKDLSGHAEIQYVGQFGDELVWHWQRPSARADVLFSVRGVR